jgi:hypothetical protein
MDTVTYQALRVTRILAPPSRELTDDKTMACKGRIERLRSRGTNYYYTAAGLISGTYLRRAVFPERIPYC